MSLPKTAFALSQLNLHGRNDSLQMLCLRSFSRCSVQFGKDFELALRFKRRSLPFGISSWSDRFLCSLEICSGAPCESSPLETSTSSKTPTEWAEIGRLSRRSGNHGVVASLAILKFVAGLARAEASRSIRSTLAPQRKATSRTWFSVK